MNISVAPQHVLNVALALNLVTDLTKFCWTFWTQTFNYLVVLMSCLCFFSWKSSVHQCILYLLHNSHKRQYLISLPYRKLCCVYCHWYVWQNSELF